jgi:hypothetical protein
MEAMNMLQKTWEPEEEEGVASTEESDGESEDQPGGEEEEVEVPQYLHMPASMRGRCTQERWVQRNLDPCVTSFWIGRESFWACDLRS